MTQITYTWCLSAFLYVDWRHRSICEVLAMHLRGLEFDPQTPPKTGHGSALSLSQHYVGIWRQVESIACWLINKAPFGDFRPNDKLFLKKKTKQNTR